RGCRARRPGPGLALVRAVAGAGGRGLVAGTFAPGPARRRNAMTHAPAGGVILAGDPFEERHHGDLPGRLPLRPDRVRGGGRDYGGLRLQLLDVPAPRRPARAVPALGAHAQDARGAAVDLSVQPPEDRAPLLDRKSTR